MTTTSPTSSRSPLRWWDRRVDFTHASTERLGVAASVGLSGDGQRFVVRGHDGATIECRATDELRCLHQRKANVVFYETPDEVVEILRHHIEILQQGERVEAHDCPVHRWNPPTGTLQG